MNARDVPELRHDTYCWAAEYGAFTFHQYLASPELSSGMYVPGRLKQEPVEVQAAVLGNAEAARLASAELYFVTKDMTMLTLGAAKSLPEYSLHPEDVPSECGFVVWEEPVALAAKGRHTDFDDIPVVAASWGQLEHGVWVSFWSDGRAAQDAWVRSGHVSEEDAHKARQAGLVGPLVYEREAVLWYIEEAYWASTVSERPELWVRKPGDDKVIVMDPDRPESADIEHLHRVIITTWLLMSQPIAATESVSPSRPARKRIERAGGRVSDVRLITLRHKPRPRPEGESTPVDWKHRWVVDGHWRNQWYPSRKRHKPKYIHEYMKGPEGAPLLGAEKVRVLRR